MRKQTKLWRMKSGERIRICDMTDEHLDNAIKMLERFAQAKKDAADLDCLMYGEPNGDIAQRAFEQGCEEVWNRSWDEYLPKIYTNLLMERTRRDERLREKVC